MTQSLSLLRTTRVRTVVSDELSSLAIIYEPDVNVCVIKRALPFVFDEDSGATDNSTVRFFMSEGVGRSVTHERLASDLSFLAELLSDLTGADDIGVRVSRRTSPMCPAFHVDNIPLRLLCTYIGPGTEWIDQSRGSSWFDCGTTQRQGRVRAAVAGDIVLLKGEGWIGNEGKGAAHCSPAHHDLRVIVSLDPLWLDHADP